MTDNRQFSQLSGRTDAVERPVLPDEKLEERDVVRQERAELREQLGGDPSAEPEGPVDEYYGDPSSDDYASEIEKESRGEG